MSKTGPRIGSLLALLVLLLGSELALADSGAIDANFILGIGKHDQRVIFLLDIGKVLNSDEIRDITESGQASA